MSYYQVNRKEILQKARKDILKKNEYYLQNKQAIKEKPKNRQKKLVRKRKRQG